MITSSKNNHWSVPRVFHEVIAIYRAYLGVVEQELSNPQESEQANPLVCLLIT